MYDNIGSKIKGLAKGTFIIETLAAIITGAILWAETGDWWWALILFGGPIVAWISSWLLYGFGEIIDKLCDIEQNTRGGQSKTKIKETVQKAKKEAAEKAAQEEKANRDKDEQIKREMREKTKHFNFESEFSQIEYRDIVCPNCHETLSFEKGVFDVQCPFCEHQFSIE